MLRVGGSAYGSKFALNSIFSESFELLVESLSLMINLVVKLFDAGLIALSSKIVRVRVYDPASALLETKSSPDS